VLQISGENIDFTHQPGPESYLWRSAFTESSCRRYFTARTVFPKELMVAFRLQFEASSDIRALNTQDLLPFATKEGL
jgi:hypothetical protein